MSRHSRRGLVDLVVMIVMIVVLLGMGTLAFLTYDKAQKEKQYLAALREVPARQKAELDSVKARYAEVCMYIGFKGDAEYSSPEAIRSLLEEGSMVVPDYYSITGSGGENGALSGTSSSTITIRVLNPQTGEMEDKPLRVQTVKGTQRHEAKLYDAVDTSYLQAALGRQDEVINDLVQRFIPAVRDQRSIQATAKTNSSLNMATESNKAYNNMTGDEGTIDKANKEVELAQQAVVDTEIALAQALKKQNETYLKLDSDEVRELRETAFAAARDAAVARRQAREAMDAYRLQAEKRRKDDTRDPDGAVFLVDNKSGYVWINIGQKSDVRPNQTFQVFRADAARSSSTLIAEIRVQEVLQGNIARCRVDTPAGPDLYPEAGDIIKNPNFSDRQYYSWALVGKFGGEFTKYTKQQLTDMLRGFGYRVTNNIELTTDAVIIGGDWDKDKGFTDAIDPQKRNLKFEKYPESEVLWFLGLEGPDKE